MGIVYSGVEDTLLHQLHAYWPRVDDELILSVVPDALESIRLNYEGMPNKRFYDGKDVFFSPLMSVQWMNFLYRTSHAIYKKYGGCKSADQVYYLNKIMHSNDWFYAIDLPSHFHCEHPLGSVLGRATYGDYFFVYQGTTVGGNRSKGVLSYPQIGTNVIMFANATVLGNTKIGNNVVVSAGTQIINETIPDNCIVFGKSPSIIIKNKTEAEIKKYTQHIWGWEIEA